MNKIFKILDPRFYITVTARILNYLTNRLFVTRTSHINKILVERDYKNFIEIGVWKGENIINLVKTNKNVNFIGIDPLNSKAYGANEKHDDKKDLLKIESEFIADKLIKYEKKYENFSFMRVTSVQGSKEFKAGTIDMVFIDAVHTYSEVKKDIETWYPKIRDGGCISGHDYSITFFGVVLAVNELLGVDKIEVKSDDSWFYFK